MQVAPNDVAEILKNTHTIVNDGVAIIHKARDDYRLTGPLDDSDGPLTRLWKRRDAVHKRPPSLLNDEIIKLIQTIVDSERMNRPVVAGAGLVRLRQHFELYEPDELATDEQTWPAFIAKHVPLLPERIADLIGGQVINGGMMRCGKCGKQTRCPCGCGVPYISEHPWRAESTKSSKEPSALDRAAAAVAAYPEESNRWIAKQIGVDEGTVRKARRHSAPDSAPDQRAEQKHPAHQKISPIPTPQHQVAAVNAFHRELVGFLTDFSDRFTAWRQSDPTIDDDGKAALMQALYLCGDGFMRVAQELDGR